MNTGSKFLIPAFLLVHSLAQAVNPQQEQFLSSIQFAVHEESMPLVLRSQKLVRDEFRSAFETFPELKGKPYQVRTGGNEVVFFMNTDDDMRAPMRNVVANMVQHLNGRVMARGRSQFYKAAFSQPVGGYLEVTMDDTHTKILAIAAQSVPLRDLLKEIKMQVGSISYLIPGECAEQLVDWSFGEMGDANPKTIDAAMSEIATLFGLKNEIRNSTYIFTGTCNELRREKNHSSSVELLRNGLLPPTLKANDPMGARVQQVFVPVFPFGE